MCCLARTPQWVLSRVNATMIVAALLGFSFSISRADGAFIQADTLAGSSFNGLPLKARATFTTSANQLVIVLTNLQADPQSNVQNISGLNFGITSGQTNGSLTASIGKERVVNSNRTFTDGLDKSTGWALTKSGSTLSLSALGILPTVSHLIIGPPAGSNKYEHGTSNIIGGVVTPYIGLSATFTLNIPGLTANSKVKDVVFSMNRDCGYDVCSTLTFPSVPEPAALSAMMIPLLGLRRRRR